MEALYLAQGRIGALLSNVESALAIVRGSHIALNPRPFCVASWASGLKTVATELLPSRRIDFSCQPETRTFCSDPDRINEIFAILLDNAGKHTDSQAEIAIRVRCTATELALSVSDTGPGIPKDVLVRIFDPFVRASGRSGLGLGLYLARRISSALRGQITVESDVGHGSRFELTVPDLSDLLPGPKAEDSCLALKRSP